MSCNCRSEANSSGKELQYAAKIVCGTLRPGDAAGVMPPGQYFSPINIHNPSRCDVVTFRYKVAVGLPGLRPGPISEFAEATIGPDDAIEIDHPDVARQLEKSGIRPPAFIKGWVILETKDPLDVVVVYGSAPAAGGGNATFHTERVEPRCLTPCDDFGFDLSTGVAAWEVALPNSQNFATATLISPNAAWSSIPGARWVDAAGSTAAGNFTYRLRFKLCTGFQNPTLALRVLADNSATLFLNNQQIGVTTPPAGGPNPFTVIASVPANGPATGPFRAGENELRAVVNNTGNVSGLAIQGSFEVDRGRCAGEPLPLLPCPGICYRSYLERRFWTDTVCNGATSGTTGENRRLEALIAQLTGAPPGTTLEYRAHLEDTFWTNWIQEGNVCGTTGQSRRMEAVEMRLINAPLGCSIRYRVHVRKHGWTGWSRDGQTAGTTGQSRRIEAIEIAIDG